jgi:hypothetical protein
MLYLDEDSRLREARDRADALARDYQKGQRAEAREREALRPRLAHLAARLRRRRPEQAPAYRA